MGARLKAQQALAIAQGWHAGAFGRAERLRPLEHYLPSGPRDPDEGARKVLALCEMIHAKQETADGAG